MARAQTATWNREDRDLLIELRTEMGSMRADIAGARTDIKEVSTGMTARLLNLESNAVSRIQLDQLEERVGVLEESRAVFRGQVKTWAFIWGGLTFLVPTLLTIYFNV